MDKSITSKWHNNDPTIDMLKWQNIVNQATNDFKQWPQTTKGIKYMKALNKDRMIYFCFYFNFSLFFITRLKFSWLVI